MPRTLSSKQFCDSLRGAALGCLPSDRRLAGREDSRAFGGQVEHLIVDRWPSICASVGWAAVPRPGRRTLYDLACRVGSTFYGVDVKTADADEERYADGGVCSVDNLLRFLVGKNAAKTGTLIVLEVTHQAIAGRVGVREVTSVIAAPIHCLPLDDVRIENLGTGQVRLDRRLSVVASEIEWERPLDEFLKGFVDKAQGHYARVAEVAKRRRDHLAAFAAGGYRDFKSVRGAS